MDDKWFKRRQKIAGVTAEDIARRLGRDRSVVSRIYVGRQKMSLDQAKVFAEVLDVPLQDVLVHAGALEEGTAPKTGTLEEGDAAPFRGQLGDNHRALAVAQALGAGQRKLDIWRVSSHAMSLAGYLEGDFMLVDENMSELTRADDVVVADVFDGQSSKARTVLRRHSPPALVAASADPADGRVYMVDNTNVVIRGKVVASWRITG